MDTPAHAIDLDTGTARIIARKDGGIGWIILNNPERRNAISLDMWAGIARAIEDFETDPAIRLAVMRGVGDKAFCAGADISQFEEKRGDAAAQEEYARISKEGADALDRFSKPLVGMIRGFCIGGGLVLALHLDIRIAGDDAQFAIPGARLGLAYRQDMIGSLMALTGPSAAKDILFSARRILADEALRLGLVNRVVPAAELEEAVRAYAGVLADNAPLTIKGSKMLVNELMRDPGERDFEPFEAIARQCFDSADYKEGRTAFMEKRKPVFRGV